MVMTPEPLSDSDVRTDESYPVFPIFVVMDVSLSMSPVIGLVNASFERLREVVRKEPMIAEVSRIGVVSFADDAVTELGLANLKYAPAPELTCRGQRTNFAAAFRHLHGEIETSIRDLGKGARFYQPVVFYLTDG